MGPTKRLASHCDQYFATACVEMNLNIVKCVHLQLYLYNTHVCVRRILVNTGNTNLQRPQQKTVFQLMALTHLSQLFTTTGILFRSQEHNEDGFAFYVGLFHRDL
jgi:hypothetical protein